MVFLNKFCLQSGTWTREKTAIFSSTYSYIIAKECPSNHIPIGSVEFCEMAIPPHKKINKHVIEGPIDFYPSFLSSFLHRKIGYGTFGWVEGTQSDSLVKRKRLFLKPAKTWKSNFKSRIVEWNEEVPTNFYYFSEPVKFIQEWRYYIANGVVITTGWYDGQNEDELAPSLDINWPADYNGTVDFGRLDDGKLALVEAHAPFACGWYGDDHNDYAKWQAEAWESWVDK